MVLWIGQTRLSHIENGIFMSVFVLSLATGRHLKVERSFPRERCPLSRHCWQLNEIVFCIVLCLMLAFCDLRLVSSVSHVLRLCLVLYFSSVSWFVSVLSLSCPVFLFHVLIRLCHVLYFSSAFSACSNVSSAPTCLLMWQGWGLSFYSPCVYFSEVRNV